MPISFVISEDVGNQHDQNGDGWLCRRFIMGAADIYVDWTRPMQEQVAEVIDQALVS